MQRTKLNFDNSHWVSVSKLAAVAILLAGCLVTRSMAQQAGQKTFASPEEASNALLTATDSSDEKAMLEILGRDAKQIVASGDENEDAASRANFVQKYKEMHRLVKEPDGTTTLVIGAKNWPTPIPLVSKGRAWYFDTEAGKNEILYRRIGRNEISTIRVCQELVLAQKEYYAAHHNEFAQKIYSERGKHDGLYWEAADGEAQSPIGPLVAAAFSKAPRDKNKDGPAAPYRGYYYFTVTHQTKYSSGGEKSYIVNGKMTDGFAFVAYPAEYGSSGVMTFMVNDDGVVYQKDLGERTEAVAGAMKEYKLNPSWQEADEQHKEIVSARNIR
jgi:hypothetical protein